MREQAALWWEQAKHDLDTAGDVPHEAYDVQGVQDIQQQERLGHAE